LEKMTGESPAKALKRPVSSELSHILLRPYGCLLTSLCCLDYLWHRALIEQIAAEPGAQGLQVQVLCAFRYYSAIPVTQSEHQASGRADWSSQKSCSELRIRQPCTKRVTWLMATPAHNNMCVARNRTTPSECVLNWHFQCRKCQPIPGQYCGLVAVAVLLLRCCLADSKGRFYEVASAQYAY
jgi:hypothetical protein